MAYRIQYGKEPKVKYSHYLLIKYQLAAAALLCLGVMAFSLLWSEERQQLHRCFVPEKSSAEATFAQAVSDGMSWHMAAIDYCRQRLQESGYEP